MSLSFWALDAPVENEISISDDVETCVVDCAGIIDAERDLLTVRDRHEAFDDVFRRFGGSWKNVLETLFTISAQDRSGLLVRSRLVALHFDGGL